MVEVATLEASMSMPMGTQRLYITARNGLGEAARSAAALASAAFLITLDEDEVSMPVTKTSTWTSIAPVGTPPRERGSQRSRIPH